MPLELHPCNDSDFKDFQRIQTAAFNSGITKLIKAPPTEENIAKAVQKHIESAAEKDVFYLKVVDTDLDNRMVACGKWRINEHERTEEQIQSMLPLPSPEDEGRKALIDFKAYLTRVRRQFMGTKPFAFLHILVVDPEHQRRGAGALVVKWGCDRADEKNLPAFMEASAPGKGLYLKHGFEPVDEEIFILSDYDSSLSGKEVNTCMIRPAKE